MFLLLVLQIIAIIVEIIAIVYGLISLFVILTTTTIKDKLILSGAFLGWLLLGMWIAKLLI